MLPIRGISQIISTLPYNRCHSLMLEFIFRSIYNLIKSRSMGASSGKQKEQAYVAQDSRFLFKQMVTRSQILSIEDEYSLLKVIGKGSYAEVYKARSLSSKQMRAIKKVNKSKAPGVERLLTNEFELLKDIDHPNIIKIYALQEDSKYFYMVSELISGNQLYEYFLSKQKITEKEAFNIFYQVLLAVNHLHRNHIMHRDIKLENAIFDEKTHILKLIDFGNAYAYQGDQPAVLNCVGTVTYIAPEVIQRRYNYKCDNWSLGILLYLLISKTTPFGGKNQEEIFNSITNQPLEFNKQVWKTASPSIKSLISGLLQKDAKKRLQLSEVFNHRWVKDSWAATSMTTADQQSLLRILGNMRAFKSLKIAEIQLGVLVFMINFIVSIENEDAYIRSFHWIDFEGDGVITEEELTRAMVEYQDRQLKKAKADAAEIMSKLDFNSSKDISYSEFIVAAMDLNNVITDDNLETTFSIIDTDKSGSLSAGELKLKLGSQLNEQYYKTLIAYFDLDKDGEISLEEFKTMMKGLIFKS